MAIDLNEKIMPANYSASIVRLADDYYGIPEKVILEGTGITTAEVHSSNQFMSINQVIRLTQNAVKHTKTPHLGLILGQHLSLTAHGMVGIAVMSSKNFGDALNIICKFFKTRFAAFSAVNHIENDMLILTIEQDASISETLSNDPSLNEAIYFVTSTIAASICTVSKILMPQCSNEFYYQFAYPAPFYSDEYIKVLGSNISFDQGVNCITTPASFAELPLPFYDEETLTLALKNCNKLLSKQKAHHLLKHKISDILDREQGDFPDIEAISSQLNMSSRTLRRKLQAEGTHYQSLLNEKRLTLAKKYLRDSNLSIIQISAELSFSDPSYFAKIFKQWTGSLPTEYRKQYLG